MSKPSIQQMKSLIRKSAVRPDEITAEDIADAFAFDPWQAQALLGKVKQGIRGQMLGIGERKARAAHRVVRLDQRFR